MFVQVSTGGGAAGGGPGSTSVQPDPLSAKATRDQFLGLREGGVRLPRTREGLNGPRLGSTEQTRVASGLWGMLGLGLRKGVFSTCLPPA